MDERLSQRALRELYLKGFDPAVKLNDAKAGLQLRRMKGNYLKVNQLELADAEWQEERLPKRVGAETHTRMYVIVIREPLCWTRRMLVRTDIFAASATLIETVGSALLSVAVGKSKSIRLVLIIRLLPEL